MPANTAAVPAITVMLSRRRIGLASQSRRAAGDAQEIRPFICSTPHPVPPLTELFQTPVCAKECATLDIRNGAILKKVCAKLFQLRGDLVDACLCTDLVVFWLGCARHADAADGFVTDLDRHAATE